MPPGTIHYVVTLEDSLCVGGHYFTDKTFTKTLYACVYEHFVGKAITNTEHSEAHIVLFKLFVKWSDIFIRGRFLKNLKLVCANKKIIRM